MKCTLGGFGYVIQVSEAAIAEIKRRMSEQTIPVRAVRIGYRSGGCSGLQYVLGFEVNPAESDVVHVQEDLKFLCDEPSRPGLQGLHLDYSDALVGGGFRFLNPNAIRTCGCGASFWLDASRRPEGGS